MIHSLDIVVSLGMPWAIPSERLRHVLPESTASKSVKFFGVDLDGIEFQAGDMAWRIGAGEPLTGTAQEPLLAICGRKLPQGHLKGASSDRFTRG